VTIELEGSDGNLISGAVVMVYNNVNGVMKCGYDALTGTYTTKYPIPADGIFNISVKSALASDPAVYQIYHDRITNKPVINVFEDSSGSSVLLGQAIDCKRDIQVGWNSSGTNITYQITVKSSLRTLYETSTAGLTMMIPGGFINAPTGQIYYIQITAQRISGDPFFRSANYYSVAITNGETLSFNVK
jgi:hypothetical protein